MSRRSKKPRRRCRGLWMTPEHPIPARIIAHLSDGPCTRQCLFHLVLPMPSSRELEFDLTLESYIAAGVVVERMETLELDTEAAQRAGLEVTP